MLARVPGTALGTVGKAAAELPPAPPAEPACLAFSRRAGQGCSRALLAARRALRFLSEGGSVGPFLVVFRAGLSDLTFKRISAKFSSLGGVIYYSEHGC